MSEVPKSQSSLLLEVVEEVAGDRLQVGRDDTEVNYHSSETLVRELTVEPRGNSVTLAELHSDFNEVIEKAEAAGVSFLQIKNLIYSRERLRYGRLTLPRLICIEKIGTMEEVFQIDEPDLFPEVTLTETNHSREVSRKTTVYFPMHKNVSPVSWRFGTSGNVDIRGWKRNNDMFRTIESLGDSALAPIVLR